MIFLDVCCEGMCERKCLARGVRILWILWMEEGGNDIEHRGGDIAVSVIQLSSPQGMRFDGCDDFTGVACMWNNSHAIVRNELKLHKHSLYSVSRPGDDEGKS